MSTLEDCFGQVVASHLTPAVVRVPRALPRKEIEALIEQLKTLPLTRYDLSIDPWLAETARVHRAFWRRKAARESAIAAAAARTRPDLFQAGLFDRRAEWSRLDASRRRNETVVESRHRIEAALQASRCTLARPRVVLALAV